MVFMYWATLFITFSSQWFGMKGSKEFTSCNKTLSINCENNYEIVITNFNTTSHIGPRLLQQCNGHSECKVTSLDEECVKVTYWCRQYPKKAVILEMRKSSNFQLKLEQSTFSIISEGYFNGSYQNAENFKCKFSLKEMEEKRKLNLVIHELTSSVNSTKYCVQLKDTAERSFCSGPGKLHEKLKSSESSEWELVLSSADTELPNVRFWIELNFVDEKSAMINLKCHTASTKPNGWTPSSVLNSALGSLLGLTLVAMSGLMIYVINLSSTQEQQMNQLPSLPEPPRVLIGDVHSVYNEISDDPPPLPPFRARSMNHMLNVMDPNSEIPEYLEVLPSLPGHLQRSAPGLLEQSALLQMAEPVPLQQ